MTRILESSNSKVATLYMELLVTPIDANKRLKWENIGQKRKRCSPLEDSAKQKKYAEVSQNENYWLGAINPFLRSLKKL